MPISISPNTVSSTVTKTRYGFEELPSFGRNDFSSIKKRDWGVVGDADNTPILTVGVARSHSDRRGGKSSVCCHAYSIITAV
jgi:hypothetical protein